MSTKKTATPKSSIPRFKSYHEEAEFWDTHSPLDFPGEFEEVELAVAKPLTIVRTYRSREEVRESLSKLDDADRQAIALSMLGFTDDEVAAIMGLPGERCRRALSRARRQVKGKI